MTDETPAAALLPGQPLDYYTVDRLMQAYEQLVVPAWVQDSDFGRMQVKQAYVAGFGAMVALVTRFNGMTDEERAAWLACLMQQVSDQALVLTDMPQQNG